VAVNSHGLRGAEVAIPRPKGIWRVLCLGDESTFSSQTPEDQTFCALLQAELERNLARRVEVINAGVPGYCPLLSCLQVRHQLLGFDADLVILNFDPTDVADDYHYRRHIVTAGEGIAAGAAHPGLEPPRSVQGGKEGLFLLPEWARQQVSSILAHRALSERPRSIDSPQGRYLWLEDSPPDWTIHIRQALAPVSQLRDLLEPRGAELVVSYIPAPWQISASASTGAGVRERLGVGADAHYKSRAPIEAVAEFCRSQQIAICDVQPEFLRAPEPAELYLQNAAALSPAGHALYARALARFIAERARASEGSPVRAAGLSQPARTPGH
jgi:hypothetical protein